MTLTAIDTELRFVIFRHFSSKYCKFRTYEVAETAMHAGSLLALGNEWKMVALGVGFL
jgi:hypothetical protein